MNTKNIYVIFSNVRNQTFQHQQKENRPVIDVFVQDCSISSLNEMEIPQTCTKPS